MSKLEDAAQLLREACPNGHKRFVDLITEMAQLHSDKNHDYAVGGTPLGNFERVAHILSLYPDLDLSDPVVVIMVYMMKQIDATLWNLNTGHETKVEDPIKRLQDVCVYSGIAVCELEDRQAAKAGPLGVDFEYETPQDPTPRHTLD